MSGVIDWTPGMLARLRELRAAGAGAKRIGQVLGLGRSAVERQLDREGLATVRTGAGQTAPGGHGRDALPAGHPVTWGAISGEPFGIAGQGGRV